MTKYFEGNSICTIHLKMMIRDLEQIRLAINKQHDVVQNYIPPFYGMENIFIWA